MSEHHEPTTLRSHLERIRDRHATAIGGNRAESYRDAVAALAILDAADREDEAGMPSARGIYAVVPDSGVT